MHIATIIWRCNTWVLQMSNFDTQSCQLASIYSAASRQAQFFHIFHFPQLLFPRAAGYICMQTKHGDLAQKTLLRVQRIC